MPRLLRRAAALLASVALLAVSARAVLACEMESTAEALVVHAHAAHESPAESPAESREGMPHPTCDHLVGCAPLAIADGAIEWPALMSAAAPPMPFVDRGAQSPERALEPPPPKR